MKKLSVLGGLLLVVACNGQTSETDVTKAQVATGEYAGSGDACAELGWYGDGECDTFCNATDSDCTAVPGEPVVCAAFIEESDGACGRPESDPCRMQDPDCGVSGGGTDPGVVCALLIGPSDGVCTWAADDACVFQDPDCAGTVCPEIAVMPDGVCELKDDPCWFDPDCAVTCTGPDCPVACDTYVEASNGVCSRPVDDPCRAQDPDCGDDPIACAAYIELSDGVCSRQPSDPCIGQDPDCGDDPIVCAAYVEESDGVCSRDPSDPCLSQDPDCVGPIACAEYIEVPDGECLRPADDPCLFQDPDCAPPATSCAAQDAVGEGACDMFMGVAWDGGACVGVSGCSCTGADCAALFASLEECTAAHSACAAAE